MVIIAGQETNHIVAAGGGQQPDALHNRTDFPRDHLADERKPDRKQIDFPDRKEIPRQAATPNAASGRRTA